MEMVAPRGASLLAPFFAASVRVRAGPEALASGRFCSLTPSAPLLVPAAFLVEVLDAVPTASLGLILAILA
jgi:hypothetical protein